MNMDFSPADLSDNDYRVIINDMLNSVNIDRKTCLSVKQAVAMTKADVVNEFAKGSLVYYGDVIKFIAERMKHYSISIAGRGFYAVSDIVAGRLKKYERKKEEHKLEDS
jgi:hypothetical protein